MLLVELRGEREGQGVVAASAAGGVECADPAAKGAGADGVLLAFAGPDSTFMSTVLIVGDVSWPGRAVC